MNTFIKSFVWGTGRGIGNTLSKRVTEKIGKSFLNPTSKFRKRIERFDLGGDFNSARKKIIVLIDLFHEEYILNKEDLPFYQTETYLDTDIQYLETKLRMFEIFITNEETQRNQYENILRYWKTIKNEL